MRYLYLILLIFCPVLTFAQEEDGKVWVKLVVKDQVNNQPIENAQLVSFESFQIFATDPSGVFRGSLTKTDSLKIFSLGYLPVILHLSEEIDSLNEVNKVIRLRRKVIMLQEVDISGNKDMHLNLPDDIANAQKNNVPVALRGDGFSDKPSAAAAVINPIGFAHYYSKAEKSKREALEMLAEDAEQQKINEFYNRDIVQEVSEYEGEELDRFMVYCNINMKLTSEDNPLLVKQRIVELKKKFEAEKSQ